MATKVTEKKPGVFLQAEWRKLLMANYPVPPELLMPYVPAGTELDYWEGNCYISLVGFMFLNTTVMGFRVPGHRNFEEVNLRFYVRRKSDNEWKRGVVFIKEIVPKPAISWVANNIYGENYVTRRMRHSWSVAGQKNKATYSWKPFFGRDWNHISVDYAAEARQISIGSETEFITEHYWGYAKKDARWTMEYEVRHPRWEAYAVSDFTILGPIITEYGPDFAATLTARPASVFLAEGSAIEVMKGNPFCVD